MKVSWDDEFPFPIPNMNGKSRKIPWFQRFPNISKPASCFAVFSTQPMWSTHNRSSEVPLRSSMLRHAPPAWSAQGTLWPQLYCKYWDCFPGACRPKLWLKVFGICFHRKKSPPTERFFQYCLL